MSAHHRLACRSRPASAAPLPPVVVGCRLVPPLVGCRGPGSGVCGVVWAGGVGWALWVGVWLFWAGAVCLRPAFVVCGLGRCGLGWFVCGGGCGVWSAGALPPSPSPPARPLGPWLPCPRVGRPLRAFGWFISNMIVASRRCSSSAVVTDGEAATISDLHQAASRGSRSCRMPKSGRSDASTATGNRGSMRHIVSVAAHCATPGAGRLLLLL